MSQKPIDVLLSRQRCDAKSVPFFEFLRNPDIYLATIQGKYCAETEKFCDPSKTDEQELRAIRQSKRLLTPGHTTLSNDLRFSMRRLAAHYAHEKLLRGDKVVGADVVEKPKRRKH